MMRRRGRSARLVHLMTGRLGSDSHGWNHRGTETQTRPADPFRQQQHRVTPLTRVWIVLVQLRIRLLHLYRTCCRPELEVKKPSSADSSVHSSPACHFPSVSLKNC